MFNLQRRRQQQQPLKQTLCVKLQRIVVLYLIVILYLFIILDSISIFVVATTTKTVSFVQQQSQMNLYYNNNYYYNNNNPNNNNNNRKRNNRRISFISRSNTECKFINSKQTKFRTKIRFKILKSRSTRVLYPNQQQSQQQYYISSLCSTIQNEDAANNNYYESNDNKNDYFVFNEKNDKNIATTKEVSTSSLLLLLLQSEIVTSESSFVNMTKKTTTTTENINSINNCNTNNNNTNNNTILQNITIRYCTYNDLPDIATVIVNSFYNISQKNILYHMYRMAELNRLQQTYSYGDDVLLHRMIVATIHVVPIKTNTNNNPKSKSNKNMEQIIIGYVDIDIRPVTNYNRGTFTYNPRPYLSDLCIEPYYRRYGIAKQLVLFCENYCVNLSNQTIQLANNKLKVQQQQQQFSNNKKDNNPMKDFIIQPNEIYIRVEQSNVQAIQMYTNTTTLQYKQITNPDDIDGKEIIILYKQLKKKLN